MTYFRSSEELDGILTAFFESFLRSEDGRRVSELAAEVEAPAVLHLHVTRPEATLEIDFGKLHVRSGTSCEASVQLEVEADVLHDVLLERLDAVQISRPFEEDRAAIEGTPEALVGFIQVAGLLARAYPGSLVEQGRGDLLETPAPTRAGVWRSDGPPKRVIGKRRPWQRARATA